MKTRMDVFLSSVLILSMTFLLSSPAVAQRSNRSARGGGRTTQSVPRANQGHIPPAPSARTNPAEQRQAEHMSTGHVNDMPHVNHDRWFGHEQPNDVRFHMDQPFSRGRFAQVGEGFRFSITRIDGNLHRFWFPGGFSFEVAAWDWPLCADWCWTCGDDFVVYDDPDHLGWYMLYNLHTGVFVHVQYMGM
jgi:hypothetical protein